MTNQPKSRKSAKTKVALAHSSTSKLRHFKLVHARHSGKVVEHQHTSYFGLAAVLLIAGLIIYTSRGVWADPPPVSHNVTVDALVAGPPPTDGATITSPTDGAIFTNQTLIVVSGTCADDTLVVVSSNGVEVGSTNCDSGTFSLTAQLSVGQDILSAKNYDFANQAGPDTQDVTVTLKQTPPPPITEQKTLETTPTELKQILPVSPAVITPLGEESTICSDSTIPSIPVGGAARVSVVCLPRVFKANVAYTIGILVWGGKLPYAVDIDWGDSSIPHTLLSVAAASYKTATVTYSKAGNYDIKINMIDGNNQKAFVQASATVTGQLPSLFGAVQDTLGHINWYESPVPFYLLAVALTLGFWLGDLFDHYFGLTKRVRKTRRHA